MPKGVSPYTTGHISSLRSRNLLSHVSIKQEGEWKRMGIALQNLSPAIRSGVVIAQREFAIKFKKKLRHNIRTNGVEIGWAPLSPAYAAWKDKQDSRYGSSNILRFSGTYYNSIDIIQKGYTVYVGIPLGKGSASSNEGLSVSQYANILEHGSFARNIPARPLWGPSFKQIGGSKALASTMYNSINISLKVYGVTFS